MLIDTAGRLHTSADLMRELEKVVNGGAQALEACPSTPCSSSTPPPARTACSKRASSTARSKLDALIVTKLDGTAKGGIALAVTHELELPIIKIGVGEGLDDLRDFDAHEFARALIGEFDERFDEDEPRITAKTFQRGRDGRGCPSTRR